MPTFDTRTFFELTGRGGGPVAALGTSFGMPSCLVNLGVEALNLLPSPLLDGIRGSTAQGAAAADNVVKALLAKLRNTIGIIEYDTEDGIFRFVSAFSQNGNDRSSGGFQNALGSFLGAAGAIAGFGGRLYNNYQTTVAQIDSIKDCLQSYKDFLDYSGGEAANKRQELAALDPAAYEALQNAQYGIITNEMNSALEFQLGALEQLQSIDQIIANRKADPSLEPEFTSDYNTLLSGTNLNVEQDPPPDQVEEIFRLEFGPPVSKKGKFILSVDGLYYDSQTSGIIPALLELESRKAKLNPEETWELAFDPNLGGRGVPTSINDLEQYVNTILDPNILDESNFIKAYYDQDDLLNDLIGQKNRKIFEVSSALGVFEASGASQILISNLRQVMLSETSHFTDKINKRKKQVELAVKMPVIYKGEAAFTPGNVPINDFSYLEGINFLVDIEKQREIVLDQADVSGVVLPIEVKFTQQIENSDPVVLEHLLINNVASGSIITDGSGVSAPILSVNSTVVNDQLFAMYNYLTAKTSTSASINDQRLYNSSDKGIDYNASIYGDASSVFDKGLGIAYLGGVAYPDPTDTSSVSAYGTFVRLPEQPEFQDFLYNPNGATFETWVHLPELDDQDSGFGIEGGEVSGLYRLILANENVGIQDGVTPSQDDILNLYPDGGTDIVRGLIFGFTRDVRFTTDSAPTNDNATNSINSMKLVLAPTQSYDSSSVGFLSKAFADSEKCYGGSGWHGMTVDVWDSINGVALSSCGREMCHLAVTFFPSKNEISIYFDGVNVATSSYGDVFGQEARLGLPNIPSLKKNNTFQYSHGPKLDTFFTPWILGGGYTDGFSAGNFMGGEYGGKISGLKGYLGGTRFYSKPLTPAEVVNNYDATKTFFKNVDVPNLMWEPITII